MSENNECEGHFFYECVECGYTVVDGVCYQCGATLEDFINDNGQRAAERRAFDSETRTGDQ
jgi:hypothetical protein